MYHTEGYVDKQTYFTEGNIRTLCMRQNGRNCYFWLVQPMDMEGQIGRDIRILHAWFYQELPLILERGSVYIQKELNRFGDFWQAGMEGDEGWPLLYLYYQGQMYFFGEGANKSHWNMVGGIGMCLCDDLAANGYHFKSESRKLDRGRCMAWLGNELQREMLKLFSESKMERGYFMIWEDAYVV